MSYNRKQIDRVKRRQRQPDFVRKAGPMNRKTIREEDEIEQQLEEMEAEKAELSWYSYDK
jgi:hypothetical protein